MTSVQNMIPNRPRKHSLFQCELKCEGRTVPGSATAAAGTVPGSTTAAAGMQISLPSFPCSICQAVSALSQVLILGTINSEEWANTNTEGLHGAHWVDTKTLFTIDASQVGKGWLGKGGRETCVLLSTFLSFEFCRGRERGRKQTREKTLTMKFMMIYVYKKKILALGLNSKKKIRRRKKKERETKKKWKNHLFFLH